MENLPTLTNGGVLLLFIALVLMAVYFIALRLQTKRKDRCLACLTTENAMYQYHRGFYLCPSCEEAFTQSDEYWERHFKKCENCRRSQKELFNDWA